MSQVASAVAFLGVFALGFLMNELAHHAGGSGPRLGVSQPNQQPVATKKGLYCIANRADNELHIGLAATSTCGALSSRTEYGHKAINCDRWGKGACRKLDGSPPDEDSDDPPHCPPPDCQKGDDFADWVFSTYYNLVGHCEHYHGAKTDAATFVTLGNYTDIKLETPKEVCVKGWGRGKGIADQLAAAKGKQTATTVIIIILVILLIGGAAAGAYYYFVVKGGKLPTFVAA